MGIRNLTFFQFMLMAGVWILSIRLLILAYRSIGWPTVEGKITKSDVVRSTGENGTTVWQPEVEFQYEVAGKSFLGKTVSYGVTGGTTASASTTVVRKYPSGKTVTVYYDPASPRRAVLENGPGRYTWMLLCVTTFLAAISIWGAFSHS